MTPEDHFAETLVVQAAMECFIPNWLRATAMGENNILPPNGPTEEASAYFVRCMGKAGNPEAATHQSELLRTNLNCNAHHGTCNASVFASTVAASAGSSGVTSMMALLPALQPVLHGGAAAYVAKQIDAAWEYFKAVPDDGKIGEYVTEILEKGGALYGAGHGFLKGEIEDPRSVKVRQDLQRLFPSSDYVTFCVKYWQEAIPALIAHLKKDGKTPGYRATNVDSWTYIAHIASGLFDKGMHDAPFLTFAQSRGLGWARTFLWHVIINGGKLIRGTELYMFDFPKSEN